MLTVNVMHVGLMCPEAVLQKMILEQSYYTSKTFKRSCKLLSMFFYLNLTLQKGSVFSSRPCILMYTWIMGDNKYSYTFLGETSPLCAERLMVR